MPVCCGGCAWFPHAEPYSCEALESTKYPISRKSHPLGSGKSRISCNLLISLRITFLDQREFKQLFQEIKNEGHDSPTSSRYAAKSLGRIGADAKEVVPVLRNALQDKVEVVRLSAREALARIQAQPKAESAED